MIILCTAAAICRTNLAARSQCDIQIVTTIAIWYREGDVIGYIYCTAKHLQKFAYVQFRSVFHRNSVCRFAIREYSLIVRLSICCLKGIIRHVQRRQNERLRINGSSAADNNTIRIDEQHRMSTSLRQESPQLRQLCPRNTVQQSAINRVNSQAFTLKQTKCPPVDDCRTAGGSNRPTVGYRTIIKPCYITTGYHSAGRHRQYGTGQGKVYSSYQGCTVKFPFHNPYTSFVNQSFAFIIRFQR